MPHRVALWVLGFPWAVVKGARGAGTDLSLEFWEPPASPGQELLSWPPPPTPGPGRQASCRWEAERPGVGKAGGPRGLGVGTGTQLLPRSPPSGGPWPCGASSGASVVDVCGATLMAPGRRVAFLKAPQKGCVLSGVWASKAGWVSWGPPPCCPPRTHPVPERRPPESGSSPCPCPLMCHTLGQVVVVRGY